VEPRLPDRIPALTERQREVADLVAQGLTNAEIGDRLGISLDGAKYHVSELLVRLNLERREQIGEWARANRRGFVRRWGLMALAAVLGSAVAVVAVLVFSGDSSVGPADGDDSEGGASLAATLEPTLEPTSTVGAPAGPIVLGDLTNAERLELLYQPIPWHDGRRANRVPLGADPLAYVMDWAGYQDGYHFVDPPTEGFDPDQLTGPVVRRGVSGEPARAVCELAPVDAAGWERRTRPLHTRTDPVAHRSSRTRRPGARAWSACGFPVASAEVAGAVADSGDRYR